jgi:hypothetical protein
VRKLSLLKIFKAYKEPHQLAAITMLEHAMPDELLERDAEWITCFFAEPDSKESAYN